MTYVVIMGLESKALVEDVLEHELSVLGSHPLGAMVAVKLDVHAS